jgi:hypothetical protein
VAILASIILTLFEPSSFAPSIEAFNSSTFSLFSFNLFLLVSSPPFKEEIP